MAFVDLDKIVNIREEQDRNEDKPDYQECPIIFIGQVPQRKQERMHQHQNE